MDSIVIVGGTPLKGTIEVSGSKNAALPIMACAMLTADKLILHNVPRLADIRTMKVLLEQHGAIIEVHNNHKSSTLIIDCSTINNLIAHYDMVRKMRASIWVLGPLLARFGTAEVSLPGGCAIGARQVDLHLAILESMGAIIEIKHGYIYATTNGHRLRGVHFCFNKVSVGATINAIMAATLAEGTTLLSNCAQEPEIVDLCNCLNKMGANIVGVGTSELEIIGSSSLHGTEYRIMPDRIEAGTYMIAASITKGDVTIRGIDYHIVENLALKLTSTGVLVAPTDNGITVRCADTLRSVDMQTQVYPGFATDLQAQFMSLMTVSQGVSVITENIFENRFMHVPELNRMGANIIVNANTAVVRGVDHLSGAEVMASDLRASVSLILAGLVAVGETKVRRVYHLDRGYQALEEKLASCGAQIRRVAGDAI